jgi:hypothetical protein
MTALSRPGPYLWLLLVTACIALIIPQLSVTRAPTPRVAEARVYRLALGMSGAEVRTVLGAPSRHSDSWTEYDHHDGGRLILGWTPAAQLEYVQSGGNRIEPLTAPSLCAGV